MTIHREKYKDSTETKVEVSFLRWRGGKPDLTPTCE